MTRFNPKGLVLYGAGSHAHVLESLARLHGYEVAAILNDWEPPRSFIHPGPIIVGEQAISEWLTSRKIRAGADYAVSIGHNHGAVRHARHTFLRAAGLRPFAAQHPTAFVDGTATVGEASQILAFAHVGPLCRVGEAVILNTRASIDHECVLGDGVHVAPGATLAGRVTVGRNTMIGTGASVGPDVAIAPNCIIGAGAAVVADITEPGTYLGVPARKLVPHATARAD